MPRRECPNVLPSSASSARWLAAGVLGIAAPLAHAMLIGQPASTPILGQNLRLSIPVQLAPGEQLGSDCVIAQVTQGDQSLSTGQIALSVHAVSPSAARLDLSSRVPITEPYVILTLKFGCQFQRAQQYTLLVNPPNPELVAAAGSVDASETSAQPAPTQPAPTQSAATVAAPRAPSSTPARGRATHGSRSSHAAQRHPRRHAAPEARVARRRAPPGEHAAAANQLRLDWMSPDSVPHLSISTSMQAASAPANDALRRQAAALRDALMGGASAPAQSDAQLAKLAAQVAALEADRARDNRRMAEVRAEAAQAEADAGQRVSPSWVWLLGAIAAVLAGFTAWLWRERRGHGAEPWFEPSLIGSTAELVAAPRVERRVAGFQRRAAAEPARERDHGPDTIAVADDEASADSGAPAPAPAPTPKPAPSLDREAFSRPLSGQEQVQVDEMMDTGHLADFFIGIGNFDQAIEVMRKALADRSGGLLALPYLYLFDLYRRSGRQADYDELLEQFAHRFNVRIPAWNEQPETEPRDIEAYPRAISLICETWGQGSMVTVIERMLLDDPTKPRVGFDLPAYRDLLDLYAIARDVNRTASAAQAELSSPPLPAAPAEAVPREALDVPLQLDAPRGSIPDLPETDSLDLPPLEFTLDKVEPRPRGDEDATFELPKG